MKQLLFATFLALPAATFAQSSPAGAIDEVRKNARMHFGAIYFTPSVHVKELGVDTNVFNQAADPKSDFTFTLSPKATVWIPVSRRALFKSSVVTDLVYYAQYSSERSVDPGFDTRGEVYFHRITLFAENQYINTRQRPNYEIDLRSRHLESDTSFGADIRLTPKFSVEVAGVLGITEYDADAYFDGTSLQDTLNRDTSGYRLVARQRATPLTTIAVRYDVMQDRFPYSPLRDSNSYRVMPGVEFKAGALISGSAYVGYRNFNPLYPGVLPDFSGLVSELGLSYTLLGSTTLGVSYRRDLTYSYEETQPFFINNIVGASVRRALGRRFDVLLSTDRYLYEYSDLIPSARPPAPAQRIDTTWHHAGSVGYRVGRDGRIAFGVSYYDHSSTSRDFRAYDGLRIGSIVTYGF